MTHAPDLAEVAQDDEIWRWLTDARPAALEQMRAWVRYRLDVQAGGDELPFAVVDQASGRAIGSTRYLAIVPAHKQLEVGGTWYGRAYWRTAVNTECKYLMLQHAFESLECIRVQLMTDVRNERSQRAIERLGAMREGVLRN